MSIENLQLIKLPSHFSQVQLSGLKEIIDHHHENGHQVQFDAGDVDRIDGAAVQFLLAISKLQTGDDSTTAVVTNINEIVRSALDDMGIDNFNSSGGQEVLPA